MTTFSSEILQALSIALPLFLIGVLSPKAAVAHDLTTAAVLLRAAAQSCRSIIASEMQIRSIY